MRISKLYFILISNGNYILGGTLKKVITISLLIFLICSCGHTNNLGHYILRGKKAFYIPKVEEPAKTIEFNIQHDKKFKEQKQDLEIEDILEIGSEVVTDQKINTFKEYIDTEIIANNITAKVEDALITFLDIKSVDKKTNNPDFLVEVILKHCKVDIRTNNISLSINAASKITDVQSGSTIWENWENYSVQIGEKFYEGIEKLKVAEKKILTAVELMALSNSDLENLINQASISIGEKLADVFREDYNEAVKNKAETK